ncbi:MULTISPECIES: A/G-specific adenine glycosylase [unclassified Helicobacter]|uniref:A/G-specific adenine glycosylase n=1 Tax=unclassified Helicobacter TaxID=2593540 RepID=UPI001F3D0A7C|nr:MULTISPECIES: A/G-specific adenine glycosylase [unclassified Helicobacter]
MLFSSLALVQQRILEWYEKAGRKELPWRNLRRDGSEAYGVYVSEIMLQQTQVSRVLESFYFPFLERFPTLRALSEALESEVLLSWQGLGYYSRARNMRKCAQICAREYGAQLPADVDALKRLPGIGSYTAGAIACFGFGESVGFVDANIRRVLARLFALQNPSQKELESLAHRLLNKNASFEHNQALFDLGALICTPAPRCLICPLSEFCQGKSAPARYPLKTAKQYENLHLKLCIFYARDSVRDSTQDSRGICFALRKAESGLYAGLYNLPHLGDFSPAQQAKARYIGEFKHSYTKYKITASVYALESSKDSKNPANDSFTFAHLGDLLPISNLTKKALKFANDIS